MSTSSQIGSVDKLSDNIAGLMLEQNDLYDTGKARPACHANIRQISKEILPQILKTRAPTAIKKYRKEHILKKDETHLATIQLLLELKPANIKLASLVFETIQTTSAKNKASALLYSFSIKKQLHNLQ